VISQSARARVMVSYGHDVVTIETCHACECIASGNCHPVRFAATHVECGALRRGDCQPSDGGDFAVEQHVTGSLCQQGRKQIARQVRHN
jgi:hypothetical protein